MEVKDKSMRVSINILNIIGIILMFSWVIEDIINPKKYGLEYMIIALLCVIYADILTIEWRE